MKTCVGPEIVTSTEIVVLALVHNLWDEWLAGQWCLAALCPHHGVTPGWGPRPHTIETSVGVGHFYFGFIALTLWTFDRILLPPAVISPRANAGGPGRFALRVVNLVVVGIDTAVCRSFGIAACSRTRVLLPRRAGLNRTGHQYFGFFAGPFTNARSSSSSRSGSA